MQDVRLDHPGSRRLVEPAGDPPALLAEASRSDAAGMEARTMRDHCRDLDDGIDLGDLIVVLLASTLAGLRDRLHSDGFIEASELVADLVEITDDYLTTVAA